MVSGTMCGGSIPFRCVCGAERAPLLYDKEDKSLDNFREWLSDNLRYFMLGGAILIIVAVLFFGIRACVGSKNKGNSDNGTQTTAQDTQESNPSSPASDGENNEEKKDDNPLEEGSAEMTALFTNYYDALGKKDVASVRNYVDNLSPSDEARIMNALYIEGYELESVYVKKGLTDGTYVAYSTFNYICSGVDTHVPALSQFYVITDSQGNLKIDGSAESNAEITAYTEAMEKDEDVAALASKVKTEYKEAQENDPKLAEFLKGLGDDAASSSGSAEGTMMTAIDDCNVRAAADGEAEIIGGLAAGTQVEKKGQEGEWIQIDYEGQKGYVHSSLLE